MVTMMAGMASADNGRLPEKLGPQEGRCKQVKPSCKANQSPICFCQTDYSLDCKYVCGSPPGDRCKQVKPSCKANQEPICRCDSDYSLDCKYVCGSPG